MQEIAFFLSLKTHKLYRFLLGPIFPTLLISGLLLLIALRAHSWAKERSCFCRAAYKRASKQGVEQKLNEPNIVVHWNSNTIAIVVVVSTWLNDLDLDSCPS